MGYSAKQRKVKTKVEGADKLVKDIRAMEDAASSVLMTGAKAGGKIALDDARKNCPVDTGTLKASLKIAPIRHVRRTRCKGKSCQPVSTKCRGRKHRQDKR